MSAADIAKNVNKLVAGMPKATLAGVVEAAMVIRRESQKLTPVAFGNLRNSAYVTWGGGTNDSPKFVGPETGKMGNQHSGVVGQHRSEAGAKKEPFAIVGFSAVYALAVHENPNAGTGKGAEAMAKAVSTRAKKSKASQSAKWRARGVATSGQWKFLQTALANNRKRVQNIITKAAVKGKSL